MTPIEKLKAANLAQWQETDICNMTLAQQCFLALAPELIALWEAVDHDYTVYGIPSDSRTLNAIKALNAKAAELFAEGSAFKEEA